MRMDSQAELQKANEIPGLERRRHRSVVSPQDPVKVSIIS
jgi:hypothetical protein